MDLLSFDVAVASYKSAKVNTIKTTLRHKYKKHQIVKFITDFATLYLKSTDQITGYIKQ